MPAVAQKQQPREQAVSEAIGEAQALYTRKRPKCLSAYEAACDVMPGGNTRSVLFHAPFPIAMGRGAGSRLWDADGHEYVDLLGEYTAGLYGHSHPVIRKALLAALEDGLSLSAHNLLEARLAKAICDRFPSLDLVRFTNSGTEANLMALATAKVATGRRKILVFEWGYHGGVLYFAGGGSPVNVPHEFVLGQYNDIEGAERLISAHGADLAAIIVEPMLGSGGCLPADPAFLEALRAGADQTGAVLIFDEVMTSRLGPNGAQGIYGVTPDMTTMGKYLGGGLSFGAFGGRADLMALYDPRRPDALPHAGTFNNNVLSMAAGYAGLSELFTSEACLALAARGDQLRETLNAKARARGAPVQWLGIGSMMGVHFTDAPVKRIADVVRTDQALKELLYFDLLESGFYIARRGMAALSLVLQPEELTAFAEAFDRFLEVRAPLMPGR